MTDTEWKVEIGTENAEAAFDHGAICIKLDLVESEKSSAWMKYAEPPFPCYYVTSRNGYCKCVMTSMAESKRVFKNHKLHSKLRWTYNIISAFSWSGVYIYIYIHILITLYGGKSCLVAIGVAVPPPLATETVLLPLVGGWRGQGNAHVFTRCMMKKNLNICEQL